MPLISAFGKKGQAGLCKSEASLVYTVSSKLPVPYAKALSHRAGQGVRVGLPGWPRG